MAENVIGWISHHFLETFGLLTLIFHGLHILLKQLEPVLDEARARYLQVKSWKTEKRDRLVTTTVSKNLSG